MRNYLGTESISHTEFEKWLLRDGIKPNTQEIIIIQSYKIKKNVGITIIQLFLKRGENMS